MLIGLMTLISWAQLPSNGLYSIDATRSTIELGVFIEGLFKAFGHDHKIAAKSFSGTIQFNSGKVEDSSVTLSIESKSLTVLDPDASEKDRREVQATMEGTRVLNAQEFPKISFRSTRVSNTKRAGDDIELTLAGKLNFHGVEKEITLPIRVRLEKALLRAMGMVSVAQTDFGLTPIKVGGGTVRVKDVVKVSFNLVAERTN